MKKFKKTETGYHKYAVMELAEWVGGRTEVEFKIDDRIVFVPDVVTYKDGHVDTMYEIVYSHPIDGKKLAWMQYYSYVNSTPLTVHEVSAEFILAQTEKPERIQRMETHIIETNGPKF